MEYNADDGVVPVTPPLIDTVELIHDDGDGRRIIYEGRTVVLSDPADGGMLVQYTTGEIFLIDLP